LKKKAHGKIRVDRSTKTLDQSGFFYLTKPYGKKHPFVRLTLQNSKDTKKPAYSGILVKRKYLHFHKGLLISKSIIGDSTQVSRPSDKVRKRQSEKHVSLLEFFVWYGNA
jgi:hypothetical protein